MFRTFVESRGAALARSRSRPGSQGGCAREGALRESLDPLLIDKHDRCFREALTRLQGRFFGFGFLLRPPLAARPRHSTKSLPDLHCDRLMAIGIYM